MQPFTAYSLLRHSTNGHATSARSFQVFPQTRTIDLRVLRPLEGRQEDQVDRNVANMSYLREKIGNAVLQMPDNFGPKVFWTVLRLLSKKWTSQRASWPRSFRHTDWHNDQEIFAKTLRAARNAPHHKCPRRYGEPPRPDAHASDHFPTAFVRWVATLRLHPIARGSMNGPSGSPNGKRLAGKTLFFRTSK